MSHERIKDLNNYEKPREKLIGSGVESLTDIELLAIILRSGGKDLSAIALSRKILKSHGSFKDLMRVETSELAQTKYIGVAKAASIKAACEIARRINNQNETLGLVIHKPKDIHKFLKKELYNKESENLYLICLDSRGRVISKDLITTGTISETLISPREIFKKALSRNAVSIILAHNHPSNDSNPSLEDIEVSKKLFKAGKEIGITLIDHIIVCDHSYSSIKALGFLNKIENENEKGGDFSDKNEN